MIGYYLSHPQVVIDATVPIPDWSLSATGRNRIVAALDRPWLRTLRRIVSSEERKAIETADLIAGSTGITRELRPDMGENDRSATGFLEPEKFEAAADTFFGNPDQSWQGWERAVDAQNRIVAAIFKALREQDVESPVLFVGHGAVGTLLKCHLTGRPIARSQDQPPGGGNLFAFSLGDRTLRHDWTAIEAFEG